MDIIPHKCCIKCGADKPLTDFHRQSRTPDGYRTVCKVCRKLESLEYYWRDPELHRAKMLERRKLDPNYMRRYSREPNRCAKCGELKTQQDFVPSKKRKKGFEPYCKACQKQYRDGRLDEMRAYHKEHYGKNASQYKTRARAWSMTNVEKRKRIRRRWTLSNPVYHRIKMHERRLRKQHNGGSYTMQQWHDLCSEYNDRCLACGKQCKLTADHIVPVSRGGSGDISNIQPLCGPCNSSKGTKVTDYRHDKNSP